jgi:hypothetical protein
MRTHLFRTTFVALAVALIAPAGVVAKSFHPQEIAPKTSPGFTPTGFARSADGTLHVAYETNVNWGNSANGVGVASIAPSGHVGPQVQALSWGGSGGSPNGIPGLAVLPGGTLEAVFGGSPSSDDGPWGISSTDGGSTWSSPADIGSGSMEFGDSALTLQVSKGTPVFTAGCCGGIVIQQGFGTGSPTYLLTNNSDNAAGNTDSAVDAATGADVASWDSNAGSGGLWLQQVAPSPGPAVKAPIPSQYGTGVPLIVAGRDSGPGVFAAYPANWGNPTTHIRLLRYGGGSVAVGAVKGLFASRWGVATGSDGRIWVFWYGEINGKGIIAVTRSNNAVTRFEPIQQYHYNWDYLDVLQGDGRLGPLDMVLNGAPNSALGQQIANGLYWARVRPQLSASVAVEQLSKHEFKLKVHVSDAGDPVSGATASALGHSKTTNVNGQAKLKVTGSSGESATVAVSAPGYNGVKATITL